MAAVVLQTVSLVPQELDAPEAIWVVAESSDVVVPDEVTIDFHGAGDRAAVHEVNPKIRAPAGGQGGRRRADDGQLPHLLERDVLGVVEFDPVTCRDAVPHRAGLGEPLRT